MSGWKIKPEDFRWRTSVLSDLYVTHRREGVCCVQRQPALTHKAFCQRWPSAGALLGTRRDEERKTEHWQLGPSQRQNRRANSSKMVRKMRSLPRRRTCSHQRRACLCLQRVAVMFEVLLLGLLGCFRGHSATQGRM